MRSFDRSYTEEEFVQRLRKIKENVGAVGNTLDLLGIKEKNLPIANAGAWELKSQRSDTSSLTTLIHFEPWPRQAKIVPKILLPRYGWPHQTQVNEMSFRVTMSGDNDKQQFLRNLPDARGLAYELQLKPVEPATGNSALALSARYMPCDPIQFAPKAAPFLHTDRGDSLRTHIFDTIKGGDYLVDQDAVERLVSLAPNEIYQLEHRGIPDHS